MPSNSRISGFSSGQEPRHPLQTSDALHAAGVGFGPELVALAVHLNKHGGLSWEKTAAFFVAAFGIQVARATLCRAMLRLAAKLRPTYELMKAALPSQPVVHPDETGWREGGRPRWLWAFVTPGFTVYCIADSRGSDVILAMLTAEFAGLLGRDGWAPYLCLEHAVHQTCLAHFLRRCNEMLEIAEGRAAEYPRAVKALVGDALDLRDSKDEMPEAEFAQRRADLGGAGRRPGGPLPLVTGVFLAGLMVGRTSARGTGWSSGTSAFSRSGPATREPSTTQEPWKGCRSAKNGE